MSKRLAVAMAGLLTLALTPGSPGQPAGAGTRPVKVTVLSTMLADTAGIGEWGFAALVEVDGYRVLFDTGERRETVLRNAEELGIDLSNVRDVVLSHHHWDHVGGLMSLREAVRVKNAAALSQAHVAPGMFQGRRNAEGGEANRMLATRPAYEGAGGTFVEHRRAEELAPGVWITGPVARHYPERNFPRDGRIATPEGVVEDTIPEDQALVVNAGDRVVVITGCGHAGIGNILARAREIIPSVPIRAVVGGLHLLDADEKSLAWTAERMKEAGVEHLLGAHCTGIEAVFRLRSLVGLDRRSAVVGAVGSSYSSMTGIDPLWLAR